MLNQATQEGIQKIKEAMIDGLLKYLHTGDFPNNSPNSYMIAYSAVHSLADDEFNSSQHLFDYYKKTIIGYINEAYKKIASKHDEELVDAFLVENDKCNILNYWMKRIFTYLDKFFTKNKNLGTLSDNSLKIYREKFFIPLKNKLYDAVNKLIKEDRECNVIYRHKIKNVLKIIEEIDLKEPEIVKEGDKLLWTGSHEDAFIREWFNGSFKKETIKYVNTKGINAINSMSAQEYIKTILKYLDEEDQRKMEYINKIFWSELDDINSNAFVTENTKTLSEMETGFAFMFKNKKDDEIKESYRLISRVRDCLKFIANIFDMYIRERGNELYKNKDLMKDPVLFVPKLIELNKEMNELVTSSFKNDIYFQDTKNKAFSLFMNKEFYSKQLSNYTDYLMKRGIKAFKEPQIEDALNEVINLFKCLNNKLAFQLDANKKLRDRLIQNKSLSLVAEKSFISKLKAEAGVTYVNKMTEMMKDLELSKDIIDSYRKSSKKGKPNGIGFVCQVVSQSAWEIEKTKMEKIEIPKILISCMNDFTTFYTKSHKNQKLNWCYGLGTLEIQYLYLPKKYISVSTLMQLSLLCTLEKYGKCSIEKISNIIGVDSKILAQEASGLVFNPSYNKSRNPNLGIIIGNFKDELDPTTEIEINEKFACNSMKFQTLPMLSRKKQDTHAQDQEDAINVKKYQDILLQLNITRIMKSRIGVKTNHVWLVSETAKQIETFKAQPQQIKEAIEKLIEKNIMKRCDNDRTCYEYVA